MCRFISLFVFLFQISISFAYESLASQDTLYRVNTDTVTTIHSKVNKARVIPLTVAYSSTYAGAMSYLQYVWYKDHERVPFHYYDDLGGYNQIDKFGHCYGAYLESYVGYKSLLWSGVSRNKALLFGGTMGFIMQLPIEIWDGMYEGWGFSWTDIGANTLGSAIVIGQELAFNDQVVKYKFTFSPSPYADQANGYLGDGLNELMYDYNGHTYWLSCGLKSVVPALNIPEWVNIAVGYSAGGMFGEFENEKRYKGVDIPETERYRQYLLSLDIDLTKIPTKSKFLKGLLNSMFMIKIPFPTLEVNSKGEFIFHSIYY